MAADPQMRAHNAGAATPADTSSGAPASPSRPLRVLQLTDGKRGHEVQVEGLVAALGELRVIEQQTLHIQDAPRWWSSRWRCDPAPDLVLAAGHGTHKALLAAGWHNRHHNCQTVVLMKPSLPARWFSACIVPRHDGCHESAHVWLSEGSLNTLRQHTRGDAGKGLLLIGGPSKHVRWDSAAVAAQVADIVHRSPAVHWQLSTSRRTPGDFLAALKPAANLAAHDWRALGSDWLRQAFSEAAQAWISNDSVNMIYEALTAGLKVGLLRVPETPHSRVQRGIRSLCERGWIAADSATDLAALRAPAAFNEARRIAALLLARLFPQDPFLRTVPAADAVRDMRHDALKTS